MRQKFITKCVKFFITKCDSFIRNCDSYYKMRRLFYKMRQLLQNATLITICDSTTIDINLKISATVYLKVTNTNIDIK